MAKKLRRIEPVVVGFSAMADQLEITTRQLRWWVKLGVVPVLRISHKICVFQPSRVADALAKREIAPLAKPGSAKTKEINVD